MSLENWGWNPAWAERLAASGAEGRPARVSSQSRTRWTIETDEGSTPARVPASGPSGGAPTVGDWVVATPGDAPDTPWLITDVLPRRSKFSRKVAGDKEDEQVVAANVDRVWIVHGLDLPPNPRRLERYLAVAWESGAQPEIILTKADIAIDLDEAGAVVESVAFGVPVWRASAKGAPGTEDLERSLVSGETIALLGPSGVGKSSLVNDLAGAQLLDEGEVRAGDRKGRHTTTRRQLVRLEGGAILLDTPGMRELQLWDVDVGLGAAFPEIEELSTGCRFRDCRHEAEPGCAVLAAVAEGELGADRLESYRKLQAEAKHHSRKRDPRLRAEATAEVKSVMRSLRRHPKDR